MAFCCESANIKFMHFYGQFLFKKLLLVDKNYFVELWSLVTPREMSDQCYQILDEGHDAGQSLVSYTILTFNINAMTNIGMT